MRKFLLKTFIFLASFTLLAAAALGLYLNHLDADDYRRGITALVEKTTDYRLEIVKPFTMAFTPRPAFTAGGVRITLPGKARNQLAFTRVVLRPRLWTLLHGRLEMELAAACTDRQSLHFLLPQELLAITRLELTGHLTTNGSDLDLDRIRLRGSNPRGLLIEVEGSGRIDDFNAPQPFRTLDLDIKVASPDSHSLRGYLLDGLPELGPVRGKLHLRSLSRTDLAADGIDLNFGDGEDFNLEVRGKIAKIPVDPKIINTGLEFRLAAQLARTSVLARLFGRPLPEIGPLSAEALFAGSKQASRLTNLVVTGGKSPGLRGEVTGSVQLGSVNDPPASFLRHLELAAFITAPPGSRIPLSLSAVDRSWQVPNTAPVSCGFTVAGNLANLELENFTLQGGRTTITGEATASFATPDTHFNGIIRAETVYLDDFFPPPADDEKTAAAALKTGKEKKTGSNAAAVVFSRQPLPLEWLPHLTGSLEIRAEKITGMGEKLANFQATIRATAGRLVIAPARFTFMGGSFQARLVLDDSGKTPTGELQGTIDGLDLGKINRAYHLDLPITGKITAHTKMRSRGLSPHELASNLNGHLQMALEEGRVKKKLLSLVAIDLLGWSLDRVLMNKKYGIVNCSILDLQATNGILDCRAFILDSPNIVITGKGSVNLAAETCKFYVYPKKKRKLWATITPVTISGPLLQPSVRAIPAKKAAMITGGMILMPQFFLPAVGVNYLWELLAKDKDKSRCLEYLQQEEAKWRTKAAETEQPASPGPQKPQ